MSYLKEFLTQINSRDLHKFLILWEEYSSSDEVDADEFIQLLDAIESSEMTKHFGQIVETALPLWRLIQDEQKSYEVLKRLINIQTTNSPALADLTLDALKKKYGNDPKFNERLRHIGLRNKDNFQGALSKYDLIAHLAKGNIVFHTGGWGTGEIIEVSLVREHLVIEFEHVSGRKDLSFANAFKTLIPLPSSHFLARRFANPDDLEREGKEDPVGLLKLMLRDLGPRTASEIKDELCELVIPEKDWTKWWQGARARAKKDPFIETPDALKDPFCLRKRELTPEERLKTMMHNKTDLNQFIQTIYTFVRDTPNALKTGEIKQNLQNKLLEALKTPGLSKEQNLQITLLLEQFFSYQPKDQSIAQQIQHIQNIEEIIQSIDILAFKKRILVAIKENRKDWDHLFLSLLFTISQAQLRDYLLKELNQGETRRLLENKLKELSQKPQQHPEMFVWYFQKLIAQDDDSLSFQDKQGQELFFEAFFVLFHYLEGQPDQRELLKKMYNLLSNKRYALVRQQLQGTSLEYTKEFLLLASKCRTLSDHDMKILRSLAEVVHPSLAPPKQRRASQTESGQEILWTTEEGYLKTQDRVRQIGTVEMIENAKEIEAARALGDLRENSEFKFAQERRARLQSELKTLSDQLNRARIITKDDVHANEVSVGSIVELLDAKGQSLRYVILGPWDADPERHILSFNSKFAEAMMGKKKGEKFQFKDDRFQVINIENYFNQ